MTFKDIERLIHGESLPLAGKNENGETVIIESGADEAGRFFRLTTSQQNGWLRINDYYADGSTYETYKR